MSIKTCAVRKKQCIITCSLKLKCTHCCSCLTCDRCRRIVILKVCIGCSNLIEDKGDIAVQICDACFYRCNIETCYLSCERSQVIINCDYLSIIIWCLFCECPIIWSKRINWRLHRVESCIESVKRILDRSYRTILPLVHLLICDCILVNLLKLYS